MTDLNDLKRKAEAAADEFGAYDPGEAEIEFMSAVTPALVLELFAENERLSRNLAFTEQWYAVRLERLKDLGKSKGCWKEMAAIIANGTVSPNDPPLYATQLVRANHRANTAERERDQLRSDVEALQAAIKDMVFAMQVDPSCQSGVVERCRCWFCAICRAKAAMPNEAGGSSSENTDETLKNTGRDGVGQREVR